jgi:hypothetical protein
LSTIESEYQTQIADLQQTIKELNQTLSGNLEDSKITTISLEKESAIQT